MWLQKSRRRLEASDTGREHVVGRRSALAELTGSWLLALISPPH